MTMISNYISHWWIPQLDEDNVCYWKCIHCGVMATYDYAEMIGLDKLDLVEPCKRNVVDGYDRH